MSSGGEDGESSSGATAWGVKDSDTDTGDGARVGSADGEPSEGGETSAGSSAGEAASEFGVAECSTDAEVFGAFVADGASMETAVSGEKAEAAASGCGAVSPGVDGGVEDGDAW